MAPSTQTANHKRLDIQGLRTVAVVLVVLDHLTGWPAGGFVGVDVFFVISGFLITGLLIREHESTGHISFTGFYRRRLRRIVPAATLVIVATVVASYFVYGVGKADSIRGDGIWAFLFSANYHFALNATDYFASTAAASPLQHYWSLSVEEQFYFVWPWLMLLVLGTAGTRKRRLAGRTTIALVMFVIVLGSFAWAIHETSARPTWAYFSTASRAWELGLGALLAILAPAFGNLQPHSRTAIAWAGLSVIAASAFLIDGESGFPAPWAAAPAIGSALVLMAGIAGPHKYLWPLTNPVSVYVGDVSYSLYLWHFPSIVLLGSLLPERGVLFYAVAATFMVLVSVGAYEGFEKPIHQPTPRGRRRSPEPWDPWYKKLASRSPQMSRESAQRGGLAIVLATTVLATGLALKPAAQVPDLTAAVADATSTTSPQDARTPLTRFQREVVRSLESTSWPGQLSPDPDDLGRGALAPEWMKDGCLGDESGSRGSPIENAQRCVYGSDSAPRTAVLFGDSMAISWAPGLRKALGSEWSLHVYTTRQCTFADVPVVNTDGSAFTGCARFRSAAMREITSLRPDLVFLSSGPPKTSASNSEIRAGTERVAREIAAISPHSMFLVPPQGGPAVAECKTRTSTPADCIRHTNHSEAVEWEDTMTEAANAVKASIARADDWTCLQDIGCPAFIDGVVVLADGAHLTAEMSSKLAPLLRSAIASEMH